MTAADNVLEGVRKEFAPHDAASWRRPVSASEMSRDTAAKFAEPSGPSEAARSLTIPPTSR